MSFVSNPVFSPLSILDYRPEDSGLMLFSRWSFATEGLVNLPSDVVACCKPGRSVPPVPVCIA